MKTKITQSSRPPTPHHLAQALDDVTRLYRFALRLGLFVELRQGLGGDLIASELCQEFLLCGQIEVLVRLHFFLWYETSMKDHAHLLQTHTQIPSM